MNGVEIRTESAGWWRSADAGRRTSDAGRRPTSSALDGSIRSEINAPCRPLPPLPHGQSRSRPSCTELYRVLPSFTEFDSPFPACDSVFVGSSCLLCKTSRCEILIGWLGVGGGWSGGGALICILPLPPPGVGVVVGVVCDRCSASPFAADPTGGPLGHARRSSIVFFFGWRWLVWRHRRIGCRFGFAACCPDFDCVFFLYRL